MMCSVVDLMMCSAVPQPVMMPSAETAPVPLTVVRLVGRLATGRRAVSMVAALEAALVAATEARMASRRL